jgi:hypothetical protein
MISSGSEWSDIGKLEATELDEVALQKSPVLTWGAFSTE